MPLQPLAGLYRMHRMAFHCRPALDRTGRRQGVQINNSILDYTLFLPGHFLPVLANRYLFILALPYYVCNNVIRSYCAVLTFIFIRRHLHSDSIAYCLSAVRARTCAHCGDASADCSQCCYVVLTLQCTESIPASVCCRCKAKLSASRGRDDKDRDCSISDGR